MAGTTGSQRVPYIVLRFMRRPILVLVVVYATSMIGWAVIPGPEGYPEPLSFFHAFYFLTYTATTTGFGEIPHAFSDAQRMWSIVSLYAGVVAWLYALGAIIHLFQNPHFQRALAERRFAKDVAKLAEPFVIVCGFGNRGSLLTRGLSDAGVPAVILDSEPDRIHAVYLRDYRVPTPALCADARIPDRLIEAGLTHRHCRSVVALTADEEVNAKIAIAARLVNPRVRVVAQLTQHIYEETLATLGPDVHIVDPFQTFARYLGATIHNPLVHMLNEWLIGAPKANLAMYADAPEGRWILCGYGRMGQAIHQALEALELETLVIDPTFSPDEASAGRIAGRANQRTLLEAGIQDAAGIVVGTNADSDNLGIALNARALNPEIFVVVRQNRHRNQELFEAAQADLVVQPTLVSARRILFLLIAPLLRVFFEKVRESQTRDDAFVVELIRILNATVGGTEPPRLWSVKVDATNTPALAELLAEGTTVSVGDLVRDPCRREHSLACLPLVVSDGESAAVMPSISRAIGDGDEILFCGTTRAHRLLDASLHNAYTLRYLVTGQDVSRSMVLAWLAKRLRPPTPAGGQPASA